MKHKLLWVMCAIGIALAACKKKDEVNVNLSCQMPLSVFPCEDETIVETFKKREGVIFKHSDAFIIVLKENVNENGSYAPSGVLVPCNLPEQYQKQGLSVVFSGNKAACCQMLTHQVSDYGFGCKLTLSFIADNTTSNNK